MDDSTAQEIASLKKRHEDKILQCAEHMQEYIGYILSRLGKGQSLSVGHYARGLEADAHEIRERVRVLENINDVLGLIEAEAAS